MATTEGGRLLLVYDDRAGRESLSSQLGGLGHLVATAGSEGEGLALIQSGSFDLVICGLGTDDLDGFQTLRSLKAMTSDRNIPILALTPGGDLSVAARCIEQGVDDYLPYPADLTILRARVRMALGLRRAQEEERLSSQQAELVKYERELQIGRAIQVGFLPEKLPQPDGWEVSACFEPAREVAGDFYDAFYLTNHRRIGFVIGDVCDKGVGAALFMALVRSLIRAFAGQNYALNLLDALSESGGDRKGSTTGRRSLPSIGATALRNAMNLTNEYVLANHAEQNMFATVFFGVLDPAAGTLVYVNGGHNPPFLVGKEGVKSHLPPTGPAVGMMPAIDYQIGTALLQPGDLLFTYTDGVTEARDSAGKFYTERRLHSLLSQPFTSAVELLDRVVKDVHVHIGDGARTDDITMLAVGRAENPTG